MSFIARTHVIVFAKAPQPGFAKTRLIAALGADGAAQLARRMLEFAVAEARSSNVGTIEVCMTARPDLKARRVVHIPSDVAITEQGDGDLGERLSRATARALSRHSAVLLMGTDCPGLTRGRLRVAAQVLRCHDSVIHPTADGGYALLGLARFDATVFDGIAWSTSSVANTTMRRIRDLGWSLHCADTLHDVDVPADLIHVPAEWRNERKDGAVSN